jgi:hypothetical protein
MLLGFILGGNPSLLAEIAANTVWGCVLKIRVMMNEAIIIQYNTYGARRWYGFHNLSLIRLEEQRKKGTTPGDLVNSFPHPLLMTE